MATGLKTVVREWGRIGCIGFGGPPTHIKLLRQLCVERRQWIDATELEDAIATCNLLAGPASTQLAIYCAWRIRGRPGALVGGAAFILPGLAIMLALAALFLAGAPPRWVLGAGAGAGAAVAAVAVQAGITLMPASWARRDHRLRWIIYLSAGALSAATLGPWLVLVLLGCGGTELAFRRLGTRRRATGVWVITPLPRLAAGAVGSSVLLTLSWVAFKVGALSYGGGFDRSIDASRRCQPLPLDDRRPVPERRRSRPDHPGPVVQTVAVVGYTAAGLAGGLLASAVAFAPLFALILLDANRFEHIRSDQRARGFLDGAGPAAIGGILGSAIPLARALTQPWHYAVLAGAALLLLPLRRGVVLTLLTAAVAGVVLVLSGTALPQ